MSQTNYTCPQILASIIHADAKPTSITLPSFLPIYSMTVFVEIHLSVAFVCIRTSFLNTTGSNINGVYTYPTSKGKATITSCDIMFADKVFNTIVMDSEEATFQPDKSLENIMEENRRNTDSQLSNAKGFQMPFHSCPPNAEIIVDMKYTQDMSFNANLGDLELLVPLRIPQGQQVYGNYPLEQVISITTKIYPGNASSTNHNHRSTSHILKEIDRQPDCITLRNLNHSVNNTDYHISYHVWGESVSVDCIVQPDPSGQQGSIVLFLSPPSRQQAKSMPRNIVSVCVSSSLSQRNINLSIDFSIRSLWQHVW
jgi:hypothetical protein